MSAPNLPSPYPLAWPPARKRTHPSARLPDRYKDWTLRQALESVEAEVQRWRAAERKERIVGWELTTNAIGRGEPVDPGAAFWFTLSSDRNITTSANLMVLACDRFRKVAQNVRAISLTMERLRLVDEIGAYSLIEAVEGARALPPTSSGIAVAIPEKPWHEVLGVSADCPLLVAEAAYRALAKKAGEGNPALRELNLAIEQARRLHG